MENNNLSAADIAAVTRNNCGYGYGYGDGCGMGMGGGWFAWILIFALFGGGFGNWNNRGRDCVTESDLCNANSFSELKNQVGRMSDQQAAIARQTDNAICQLGYQNLEQSRQTDNAICQLGFQALQNTNAIQSQLADCCCTTQRAIDSVKFDMANYAAAINANNTANTQKVLDKLCEQETTALRDRIGQLELQQAFCGVPRFLPGTVYGSTHCTPFIGFGNNCGCGCGCNNL